MHAIILFVTAHLGWRIWIQVRWCSAVSFVGFMREVSGALFFFRVERFSCVGSLVYAIVAIARA